MGKLCEVDVGEQDLVKKAKKAIDVAIFFMFLIYTVATVLSELKKDT